MRINFRKVSRLCDERVLFIRPLNRWINTLKRDMLNWSDPKELVDQFKRDNIRTGSGDLSTALWTRILYSFSKKMDWKSVCMIRNLMNEDNVPMDERLYELIASGARHMRSPALLCELMLEIQRNRVIPTPKTFMNLLLGFKGWFGYAEQIIAFKRFMQDSGAPFSIDHYNGVVHHIAAYDIAHAPTAIEIYQEMLEKDIYRNEMLYNSLLRICATYDFENNIGLASSIFEQMKCDGIEPTSFAFEILLEVHEKKGGTLDTVYPLFKEMRDTNVMITCKAYDRLLKMLPQSGIFRCEIVMDMVDDMKKDQVPFEGWFYDKVIAYLKKGGAKDVHLNYVQKVFEQQTL